MKVERSSDTADSGAVAAILGEQLTERSTLEAIIGKAVSLWGEVETVLGEQLTERGTFETIIGEQLAERRTIEAIVGEAISLWGEVETVLGEQLAERRTLEAVFSQSGLGHHVLADGSGALRLAQDGLRVARWYGECAGGDAGKNQACK
ncbi:hypothetical protein STUTZSP0542_37680 [Stutzerimonas marianensis]